IIFFVLLAIMKNRPDRFAYSLYLVVSSFLVCYLIFVFFPVAGPQYYFKNTASPLPEGYLFSYLMHIIEQTAERPTAAFPSSHVGISLLMLWLAWKYVRKAFYYVLPFAVLLIISTIYLRAHYVVDVLAGAAAFPLLLLLGNKSYFLLTRSGFQIIRDT
ncbi:MAG TPA: phosphatase PAP2 family protein, partial [Bacteroidales bacterium]|nr:phosphatase PAP2 family protein [Bacteroidales bacterium]